jgi:plasmid replication initiation protein
MQAEKALRKHVAIIHAYSMMSILQRKVVNVLFSEALHVKDSQEINNSVVVECHMSFSKLAKAICFNSNNTNYLKEAIDGLASLKIEWNLLKDRVPTDVSFLNLRILHGSPTFYHNGIFNFSFHKLLFNFIGSPSIYGTIDMELQSQFESKYGHALYENSTRFLNLQKGKIIYLDTFRKLLGADGKYSSMREFNRNVIRPSVEEVNDRSDFIVDLKNISAGRKTIGFEISVLAKKNKAPVNMCKINNEPNKIEEEIKKNFGAVSREVVNNILKNYSEEYLREKIAYTKTYARKDKLGFYPIPYLIKAIKDNYQFPGKDALEEEKLTEIIDSESVWHECLRLLQGDLKHWQHQLSCARARNDDCLVENIKKIILTCEQEIQKHLLNKPDLQLIDKKKLV